MVGASPRTWVRGGVCRDSPGEGTAQRPRGEGDGVSNGPVHRATARTSPTQLWGSPTTPEPRPGPRSHHSPTRYLSNSPPPTPAPPVTALNSLLPQQRTPPPVPAPSGPGPRPPRPLQERPPAPVTSQRPPPPQRPPLTRRPPPAPRPSCPRTAPAPSRVQRSPIGCGAKERTPIGCGGHQSARPRPAWGAAEWSPPETRSATEGSGQRTEQRCPRGGADGAQQRTAQSGARQPLRQEG